MSDKTFTRTGSGTPCKECDPVRVVHRLSDPSVGGLWSVDAQTDGFLARAVCLETVSELTHDTLDTLIAGSDG